MQHTTACHTPTAFVHTFHCRMSYTYSLDILPFLGHVVRHFGCGRATSYLGIMGWNTINTTQDHCHQSSNQAVYSILRSYHLALGSAQDTLD